MDSLLEHDPDILHPPWGAYGRDLTLGLVSSAAKLLLRVLNRTTVSAPDLARFQALTTRRDPGVGLLTYCNHTSTFDDPGLPSALLPWWMFWLEHSHEKMRWTLCARDVCFKSELLGQFFGNGKTLPVERGSSVHQPVMAAVGRLLGQGAWLHVFPEGKVQPGGDVAPFRQGIGKLVCDARAVSGQDPIVLPYFHSGMARVMPYLQSLPRVGHEVTVVVGEPLDLSAITCRCNQAGVDQQEVWRDIAAALRDALLQLEARAPPNPNQLEERPELRSIIAARCREGTARSAPSSSAGPASSTPGGDSSSMCISSSSSSSSSSLASSRAGEDSSSQDGSDTEQSGSGCTSSRERLSGAVAAAAAALSQPCAPFNSFCHALAVPHWASDQERRQLRIARSPQQQRATAPWQTVGVLAATGSPDACQPPAGAADVVRGATPSRWQRLLRWRVHSHPAPMQASVGEGAPLLRGRRVWWSCQRTPAQRREQRSGSHSAGMQRGHSWQAAPA